MDESTQSEYGPWKGVRFGREDLQRKAEIGGQSFEIAGTFQLGTGLAANGAVVTNHQGFGRLVPWNVNRYVNLGLVDLATEASLDDVLSQLRERLQVDASSLAVEVLSREQSLQLEKRRWLWETPIGLIFQLGVVLSLLVGSAIVYMVLSTDVTNRLSEYATLLAMGYSRVYLASIVMTQAIVFSLIGFCASWVAAQLLYLATSQASGIPIRMTAVTVVLVAVLGTIMCCGSGLMALRKLWKAEPASLF
jgi:putative ABC transport system permease protein